MTPLRRSAWLLALLGALRLCDPANQIFETSIAVDGVELPLRLFEGQTVVTAAANFVLEHGLIAPSQEPMASLLVAQLAEALRERVALVVFVQTLGHELHSCRSMPHDPKGLYNKRS